MKITIVILFALSLCADCFAVSLCSGVGLRTVDRRRVSLIALTFAFVQAGFLFLGWLFGDLLASWVSRAADWIGFILLMYVSLSMLRSAFRGEEECLELDGLRNVLTGAIATSIDALAVGMSLSMAGETLCDISVKTVAVFISTFLSVLVGICGGHRIGLRFGRLAEAAGALVLAVIAFNILLGFI